MPSLASTDSFSRTSFVKQCPYRNSFSHTTFGCRPAFSHFAPCDRAIRRPKLALPKASPSQSAPRIVARITLRVRRLSPPTLVALRSAPTLRVHHDSVTTASFPKAYAFTIPVAVSSVSLSAFPIVKEQVASSRFRSVAPHPSSVGVRATSDERNANGEVCKPTAVIPRQRPNCWDFTVGKAEIEGEQSAVHRFPKTMHA